MRLWRRAAGALKDRNSIWIASLARRTAFRNPEIDAAVIKATSHDEFSLDLTNIQLIYKWTRISSVHLKPILWSISLRMGKTRSWVVALKGLMLINGISACRIPAVHRIGRLPFDLSNFTDGHSDPSETWAINTFIRSYYAFLDQKSTLLSINMYDRRENHNRGSNSLMQELVVLEKLQGLLEMLLQIRPQSEAAVVPLVIEAMDCVITEIFDVYSRICSGIARVLLKICYAGKAEAEIALKIIQKETVRGQELSLYFDLCREIGVMSASECPLIHTISDEDIRELESIINGAPDSGSNDREARAVVEEREDPRSEMRTIITHDWETFDEDSKGESSASSKGNPFLDPLPLRVHGKNDDLPDLISFL